MNSFPSIVNRPRSFCVFAVVICLSVRFSECLVVYAWRYHNFKVDLPAHRDLYQRDVKFEDLKFRSPYPARGVRWADPKS